MLKKFQEREICVHSIDCDCDICIGSEGFNYDETVFCVCSLDCECVICIGSVCFNSNSSSTGKDKCALVEDKVFDEISQRDEPALPCHCASDEVLLVPLIGHDHLVPSGIEPVTFSESLSEELSDATTLTSTMKADLETEQVGEAQVFSKSPHQNNNQQLSQFATIVMDPFASLVLGGIVRDVILWKRKSYSVGALLAATAIWLALEVCGLTFITLGSWIAMFVIAFIFLWGNIHMLLGKEPLDMSRMYISDESALEAGTKLREWVEKSARLLFSVSAEREWFVFAGTVASLDLLSVLASHFDLLTLLYIGNYYYYLTKPLYMEFWWG
ncbi:reticulon-like protein B1 isoform X2 [Lycium barbarum]|uniref:reticulon-like protein B1 isoform X2 n=1 Tax=Lycium barbarum TaxID=112863 RepID=UPI00293ED9EA|nr:reticulon-like protein B1 isoform X2 [Lycium barbarum]